MSEEPRKVSFLSVDDTVIDDYQCYAPESIIDTEWEDIPEEHQKIIKHQGGLSCEGNGIPGSWCGWCHYTLPHGYNVPNENAKEEEIE